MEKKHLILSLVLECYVKIPFSINNIEMHCKETYFAYSNKPVSIQILSDNKNTYHQYFCVQNLLIEKNN